MIKKILIANRGEIACRIIKTCREMGILSVSVATKKEKELPHALESDYCEFFEHDELAKSYLDIDLMISLAQKHGADAIHPGYGFLSENPRFAKALKEKGITLIGPPVAAMETMGDKIASKESMEKIKVPLIPGYHGSNQDPSFLHKKALEISYPLLIKASAGGGGKGMRIVTKDSDFLIELDAAKREAQNAFGNDQVLIEKFIENPRHIEVQVLSDTHGNHLHFFERECSIQRRYQKIIEETPSTALDDKLRKEICECAVAISSGVDYVGAGTIEFILDDKKNFYFLEMNTRLQVEHPITEMITGIDLVQWQILIAMGERLPWQQKEIQAKGHALEVRIYAEDPDHDFMPSTGVLSLIGTPVLNQVRLDTGYVDGNEVTIDFDPMLAKLVTWAPNREMAIRKMIASFDDIPFLGPQNNIEYLNRILEHPAFLAGETYTHFVKTHADELKRPVLDELTKALAIAAFYLGEKKSHHNDQTEATSAWQEIGQFRNMP